MSDNAVSSEPIAEAWEAPAGEDLPSAAETLIVDVGGFEGPLDLLLALARTHKVDITAISVLALVEQYLAYIAEAQKLKIEIAADYLVMAAWLAYLKSRLLLPRDDKSADEPSAEEMAQRLAFRLVRLEAMRRAMADLLTRKRLGRDIFSRGCPEPTKETRETKWTAEIFDLLKSYGELRRRNVRIAHVVKARSVWSIKQARQRLEKLVGQSIGDWVGLEAFLKTFLATQDENKTVMASSFGATLEMAREGLIEIRQEAPFAPIYMRRCQRGAEWHRLG